VDAPACVIPLEWLRKGAVEVVDEIDKPFLQIGQRLEAAATHHDAEDDFYLVQPRRVFRKIDEPNPVAAVGQELLTRRYGLQDSTSSFLAQRALVDALQFGHVAHQSRTAMHVQIVEHKHPAGSRVGLHCLMNVPGEIAFGACLLDRR